MKRFLIVTSILLALSLVISVASYLWVISQLPPVNPVPEENSTPDKTESTPIEKAASTAIPPEGVPLRNLPLGDTQKSTLETLGVDIETFIISPAMQTCATEKLGTERMSEIIAGDDPGVIETTRLLPCLDAE